MAPKRGEYFGAYSIWKIKYNASGLSYSWLAERLGCSKATISNFFNQGYIPAGIPDFLPRMEKLLMDEGVIDGSEENGRGQRKKYWEDNERMGIDKRIERRALMPDALEHFGLEWDPFYDESEPYISKQFQKVMRDVVYCIKRDIFTAVIGEVGWGKTTLMEHVKQHIAETMPHVLLAEVVTTDAKEIQAKHVRDAIMEAIGGDEELKGSRQKRGLTFRQRLERLRDQGKLVTVFIDDAQWLAPKMFGQLKLFSEMKEGYQRLVGIVLFGQDPELHQRLDMIRAAGWRANRLQLRGLRGETESFIKQRVQVAGGRISDVITTAALSHLADIMMKKRLDCPLPLCALMSLMLDRAHEMGLPQIPKEMVDELFTPIAMGVKETKKMADNRRLSNELSGSTGFNEKNIHRDRKAG